SLSRLGWRLCRQPRRENRFFGGPAALQTTRLCSSVIDRTYAVGVWGRLAAPEDLFFPPLLGDKGAQQWRKIRLFGGAPRGYPALQTSHLGADCVSPVIDSPLPTRYHTSAQS